MKDSRRCIPYIKETTCVLLVTLLLVSIQTRTMAQGSGWSRPVKVCDEGNSSRIIGDVEGNLHLFYQAFLGQKAPSSWGGNTILYSQLSKEAWSQPRDILAAPVTDDKIIKYTVQVAPDGTIHILWYNYSRLFHSWVYATEASNVREWQTEELAYDQIPYSSLMIDQQGTLHVAYVSELNSIMYMRQGQGANWSNPVRVWQVNDTNLYAIGDVSVVADSKGTVHLGWTETAEEVGWSNFAAWYARSTDDGKTWSEAVDIAEPSYGLDTIITGPQDQVWLIIIRGIQFDSGRFFKYSIDRGQNWSSLQPIFPSLKHASGITGGSGWAVDAYGTVHLVNSAGDQSGISRLYYTYWTGNRWAVPVLLEEGRAEAPRIAVTEGNRLHVAYTKTSSNETEGIWYTTKITGAPKVEAVTLSPHLAKPTLTTLPLIINPTDTTPSAPRPLDYSTESTKTQSVAVPLLVGTIPALLVTTFALTIRRRSNRSH